MNAATARTLLFVPGSRPELFAKAVASGADEAILDLEDAVAPADKPDARRAVRTWLTGSGRAAVRLNAGALRTDDVAALRNLPGLTAVVAAKASDPDDLAMLGAELGVPVLALVETAAGVAAARTIAATPGVVRLALGAVDLSLDLGAEENWDALLLARAELVLASRLAGLAGPVDGVTMALDNAGAVADATRRARALGFAGKLCVHPRQVAAVHQALRPTPEQVEWAAAVLAADADGAAVRVADQLVDLPVVLRAERILADHRREHPGR